MSELQDRKFPLVEQGLLEAQKFYFNSARRYRRSRAGIQAAIILLGAVATVAAGLATGQLFPNMKYLVLALTATTTALNSFNTSFGLSDLPLNQLKAGEEITDLLFEFRKRGRKPLDDEVWRALEDDIRPRLREITRRYDRRRYDIRAAEQPEKSSGGTPAG